MEEFLSWLRNEKGVEFKRVSPVEIPGAGWGLKATQFIPLNETIVSIPLKIIIRSSIAVSSYLKGFFEEFPKLLNPSEAIALWLLFEKHRGGKSEFAPYIGVFPKSFTTPATFPDFNPLCLPFSARALCEEKIRIQDNFLRKIIAQKSTLVNYADSEALKSVLNDEETLRKDLIWSWNVVNTRCIYMAQEAEPLLDCSDGNAICIVPFIDLMNHSPDSSLNPSFNKRKQCFELENLSVVGEGHELCISYHAEPNSFFLMEYGFVIPDNITNVYYISPEELIGCIKKLNLQQYSPQHEELLYSVLATTFKCPIYSTQNEPCFTMVSAFKAALMDYEELLKESKNFNSYYPSSFTMNLNQLDASIATAMLAVLKEIIQKIREGKENAIGIGIPPPLAEAVHQLWKEDEEMIKICMDQINEDLELLGQNEPIR